MLRMLIALIKFTQPVLVERESCSSRQNTVKEIQRRVATNGAWPQIIVFPEGTCTNRSCLISFKPGLWHKCVLCNRGLVVKVATIVFSSHMEGHTNKTVPPLYKNAQSIHPSGRNILLVIWEVWSISVHSLFCVVIESWCCQLIARLCAILLNTRYC